VKSSIVVLDLRLREVERTCQERCSWLQSCSKDNGADTAHNALYEMVASLSDASGLNAAMSVVGELGLHVQE
jgi:hypothetical protein